MKNKLERNSVFKVVESYEKNLVFLFRMVSKHMLVYIRYLLCGILVKASFKLKVS